MDKSLIITLFFLGTNFLYSFFVFSKFLLSRNPFIVNGFFYYAMLMAPFYGFLNMYLTYINFSNQYYILGLVFIALNFVLYFVYRSKCFVYGISEANFSSFLKSSFGEEEYVSKKLNEIVISENTNLSLLIVDCKSFSIYKLISNRIQTVNFECSLKSKWLMLIPLIFSAIGVIIPFVF